MKKKTFTFIALFLLVNININCVFAQTDIVNKRASIAIQSPNVASLNKFVEFPVNQFNGQTDISIPLYEINLKNVSVPINLKYHTGGIRVREDASSVGLGWALDAGGVISHQINGMDDNSSTKYYGLYFPFLNNNQNYHTGIGAISLPGATIPNKNGVMEDITTKFRSLYSQIDGDPDLYIYSMGKYGGKFITWENNKIDLSCNNIIFKQYVGTGIVGDSIIATTPEGNVYKFKDIENSVSITGLADDTETLRSKAVAYYLSEIVSSNKETIRFYYKSFQQICDAKNWGTYYPNYSNKFIYSGYYPQIPDISENYSLTTYNGQNTDIFYNRLRSYTFSRVLFLDKIEFPNGMIEFTYTPRLDAYSLKVDNIIIKNSNGERIKSFIFSYDYFDGITPNSGEDVLTAKNVSTSMNIDFPENYARKRLKLISFSEIDNFNGTKKESYTFTYNENSKLPYKTSFSQDFWGYHNGMPNTSLLPSYTLYGNILGIPSGFSNYATANRNVNRNTISSGSLKQITHPTGGITSFVFEPNECINSFISSTEMEEIAYSATDIGVGCAETIFTLTAKTSVDIWIYLMKQTYGVTIGSYLTPSNYLYVRIDKQSKTSPGSWILIDKYFWGGELVTGNVYANRLQGESLEAGTYKLTANFPDKHANLGCLGSDMANIRLAYKVPVTSKNNLVGGLRVKTITNSQKGTTTNYSYKNGILATHPIFVYSFNFREGDSSNSSNFSVLKKKISLTTYPIHPYSFSANGNLVGYRNVTETQTPEKNGKTEYEYEMSADILGVGAESWLPGIPPASNLTNGFLFKKTVYHANGEPKKVNSYTPILFNPKVYWGFKISPAVPLYLGYGLDESTALASIMRTYFYPIIQGKVLPKTDGESTYINAVTTFGKTTTYDYNAFGFLKSKTFKSSNSATTTETYKYPSDFTSESSVFSQMVSCNIISPIIEIVTDNNGSISKQKTVYGQPYPKVFVPSLFKVQKDSNPIETRIVFERYDSYGNVNSINKDGLGNIIYLWSYKGQYPIAEIKYSTYDTVNSALASIGLGSIEILATNANPDKSKLDNLRSISSLSNTSITTYKYFPLVGIVEETSPLGVTTFYGYDSFRRLSTIKDNNQNINKQYYYKYYNQISDDETEPASYCNVTFDTSGPGGDGSIKTVKMKYGEPLPTPTPAQGYSFEGWYDGNTKITTVPNSPNRTITGKFAIDKKGITLNLRDGWLQTEDTDSYYYAGKTIELTTNTTDVVSFIINGTQMKDPDAVRYPVTVKNNGIYQAYWEERAYRNGNWVQLSGDACKLSSFSIIVNGTYVTTNEALDSWEHGLPSRLNGSVYTKGNITCTIKLLK